VRVTEDPEEKDAEHVEPQFKPVGELKTVPDPDPFLVTVRA
jgi:hypothetical protein